MRCIFVVLYNNQKIKAMKKIVVLALIALCSYQLNAQDAAAVKTANMVSTEKEPVISFDSPEFNFGKIKAGEKVENVFKFKNTGIAPLIITDVTVTCGCTAAEKPEAPIMPGEEGKIKIVFDSKGKSGTQNRTITVNTNAKNKVNYLKLIGEVVAE